MAINSPIKVNDVVKLRSGGPEITVERIIGEETENQSLLNNDKILKNAGFSDGDACCCWFEGTELKRNTFRIGNLVKIR
jgi:uncharacterized protein YodC (DUF2158 family)